MLKMTSALTLALLTISISKASSEQICDSVLNRDLVDVKSIAVSESIITRMQADVCSIKHISASAAQQYMRTGGFALNVFSYFDAALTDTKNTGSSNYKVEESAFCDKSASYHSSNLATNVTEANAGLVLDAYKTCISATQANGLWMTFEILEDGRVLRGTLRRNASPGTSLAYSIEEVSMSNTNSARVECNIGVRGQEIENATTISQPINAGTATFTCVKSGDGASVVDLRTSISEFSLYMPSDTGTKHAKLDDLQQQIARLKLELDENRDALANIQGSIPTAVSISTSVRGRGFNNVRDWTEIPGSRGAAYCALTRVDDDSPIGACFVGRENGRWVYKTGGGGGDNLCAAHCLNISTNLE